MMGGGAVSKRDTHANSCWRGKPPPCYPTPPKTLPPSASGWLVGGVPALGREGGRLLSSYGVVRRPRGLRGAPAHLSVTWFCEEGEGAELGAGRGAGLQSTSDRSSMMQVSLGSTRLNSRTKTTKCANRVFRWPCRSSATVSLKCAQYRCASTWNRYRQIFFTSDSNELGNSFPGRRKRRNRFEGGRSNRDGAPKIKGKRKRRRFRKTGKSFGFDGKKTHLCNGVFIGGVTSSHHHRYLQTD